jgi:hypothetical protein
MFVGLIGLITHCFTHTGTSFVNFLMECVSHILMMTMQFDNTAHQFSDGKYTLGQQQVLAETPTNLRKALLQFSLESKTDCWAVCTTCRYTHRPEYNISTGKHSWPTHCEYVNADGEVCGSTLLRQRGEEWTPRCPYLVPNFYDYLGRLLSNPDIEQMCNEVVDKAYEAGVPDSGSTDVFTSLFLQNFKDRDGEPYLKRSDNIRLLFTLHYDQFNPKGVRVRSDSASVGVLNLALLNIPPSLRYLPEHIFMTLFPGPSAPRGHELNHFLRPVVDQLLVGWERGIKLSRTGLQPQGATVDVAVAYETADLLAARHLAGLAGATSNWLCSICGLFGRQNVWNVDWDTWEPRNRDHMMGIAESWLNASSEEQREEIYKKHGIRWSELWRLPYYNPIKQIVVDPMHCLLLGLVLYYC